MIYFVLEYSHIISLFWEKKKKSQKPIFYPFFGKKKTHVTHFYVKMTAGQPVFYVKFDENMLNNKIIKHLNMI